MRGKGTVRGKSIRPWRITPAYAGKSFCVEIEARWIQDHPRLCGEKYKMYFAVHRHDGITPAYAGKRSAVTADTLSLRDHPRLCGEKDTP